MACDSNNAPLLTDKLEAAPTISTAIRPGVSRIAQITVLFFIAVSVAMAETMISVKGTVVDEDRTPISGAKVTFVAKNACNDCTGTFSITDPGGAYTALIPEGPYDFTVSAIGYEERTVRLDIHEPKIVDVTLNALRPVHTVVDVSAEMPGIQAKEPELDKFLDSDSLQAIPYANSETFRVGDARKWKSM